MKIEVDGIKQFERKLKKLLQQHRVRTQSAANNLKSEIQKRAPGSLADNVAVQPTTDGHEVMVDSDHATYVEFGTSGTTAKPFVRPAVRKVKEQTIVREGQSLQNLIEKIGSES